MIEMWDDTFSKQNKDIEISLKKKEGNIAFELMHKELDKVWKNINIAVKEGGIVCINIGDAVRTINGEFKLYSNHTRIISAFLKLGFTNLPDILWRKQTNSPNKFMGSGMLPPGAYVTLEHEYILIFRKGSKKIFETKTEKENRNSSAFFWEERNVWFSDVWDFKGASQKMSNDVRIRSGSYPFELAYRLINMFSVKDDTILDPFVGLGTTVFASAASGRNSIGIELEEGLIREIKLAFNENLKKELNDFLKKRITNHLLFMDEINKLRGEKYLKYINKNYNFPVMTRQEENILINYIKKINKVGNIISTEYYTDAFAD
jgi:DNA modification methylase